MIKQAAILAAGLAVNVTAVLAEARPVPEKVEFMFDGATVNIAVMAPEASRYAAVFAAHDPSCNPHCIAPERAAPGGQTLTQPDVQTFLEGKVGANTVLLVQARMSHGRDLGSLPVAVSLPSDAVGSEKEFRSDILKALGARAFEDVFNFTDAQSLVVYDSGPTQNDAETLIRDLLAAGYLSGKKSPLSWRPASVARSWADSSGMML